MGFFFRWKSRVVTWAVVYSEGWYTGGQVVRTALPGNGNMDANINITVGI